MEARACSPGRGLNALRLCPALPGSQVCAAGVGIVAVGYPPTVTPMQGPQPLLESPPPSTHCSYTRMKHCCCRCAHRPAAPRPTAAPVTRLSHHQQRRRMAAAAKRASRRDDDSELDEGAAATPAADADVCALCKCVLGGQQGRGGVRTGTSLLMQAEGGSSSRRLSQDHPEAGSSSAGPEPRPMPHYQPSLALPPKPNFPLTATHTCPSYPHPPTPPPPHAVRAVDNASANVIDAFSEATEAAQVRVRAGRSRPACGGVSCAHSPVSFNHTIKHPPQYSTYH